MARGCDIEADPFSIIQVVHGKGGGVRNVSAFESFSVKAGRVEGPYKRVQSKLQFAREISVNIAHSCCSRVD